MWDRDPHFSNTLGTMVYDSTASIDPKLLGRQGRGSDELKTVKKLA